MLKMTVSNGCHFTLSLIIKCSFRLFSSKNTNPIESINCHRHFGWFYDFPSAPFLATMNIIEYPKRIICYGKNFRNSLK
jgi:hypothetical protein